MCEANTVSGSLASRLIVMKLQMKGKPQVLSSVGAITSCRHYLVVQSSHSPPLGTIEGNHTPNGHSNTLSK